MTRPSQPDETAVKRGLLTAFFMVVAVIVSFLAVKWNNPLLIMMIFAFPFAAWLIGNPATLLLTLFLVRAASLGVPGLPGGLTLVHVFQAAIIGWSIIYIALSKQRMQKPDAAGTCLFLFLLNMGMIISVRGFGISVLGGSAYGGAHYIYMTIGILFYFAATRIALAEKHVRIIFFGTLICSVIPFLVQASIYVTKGATYFLTEFVTVNTTSIAEAFAGGDQAESVRWSAAGNIGTALMTIALVIPAVRKRVIVSWLLIGVAVFLVLITGFRGRLLSMGALIFFWLIYDSKDRRQTFFTLLVLGLLGWGVALIAVPILPANAQRALSILPLVGDHIADVDIVKGAQESVDFRVEIWKMCWRDLPQYVLVGRGLMADVTGFAWLQSYWYGSAEFLYHMHAYHSGLFSFVMDFGIFGLVLGAGFMLAVCVKAWRGVKRFCIGRNDLISRYYAFLSIQLIYSCISYFVVYGSVIKSLPNILFLAVLLEIFRQGFARREAKETVVSDV